MPSRDSESPPEHDYRSEIGRELKEVPPGRRYSVSKRTAILLVMFEFLCWFVGAFILYWLVPVSVDVFRDHGLELPRSMIWALIMADRIVGWYWMALPLIFLWIIVPKIVLYVRARTWWVIIACVLSGLAIPLALVVYGVGLPRLIKLGVWP